MSPLTIRPAQMAVLREVFLMEWLTRELQQLFPQECQTMGPATLDRFVTDGVKRAKEHGFAVDEFLPYLSMEICFGESFPRLEGNEWADEALSDHAGGSAVRMQRLRRAAIFRLGGMAEAEQRQLAARRDTVTIEEAEGVESEPVYPEGSLG